MRTFVVSYFKPVGDAPRIYTAEWVDRMARNIRWHLKKPFRLNVVTDCAEELADAEEEVQAFPFLLPPRGWASMLEMFRPTVVGSDGALLMGLDTVFVADPSPLFDLPRGVSLPRDPAEPALACNSLLAIGQREAAQVWERWRATYSAEIESGRYRYRDEAFSEMLWLREHLKPDAWIDDELPGSLLSFKRHVGTKSMEKPADAIAVYFHGTPKQHQISIPWIVW